MGVLSKVFPLDLEAVEFFLRSAMLKAGARVLETLLDAVDRGERAEPMACANKHRACKMKSRGRPEKTLHTTLGTVRLRRTL